MNTVTPPPSPPIKTQNKTKRKYKMIICDETIEVYFNT